MFIFMMIENEQDSLKVERLYYGYRKLMYQEAYVILKDHQLSEDAVHISFERIIKNLHKVDEDNIPRTRSFLAIICRNVAKDLYNSRLYLNTTDTAVEEVSDDELEWSLDHLEITLNREMLSKATDVILNLDPIYRDVFLMRRVHGLSREDIAYTFGISLETVKKRLVRAKAKVVSALEKEGYEV